MGESERCRTCAYRDTGVCSALALGTAAPCAKPQFVDAKARSILARPGTPSTRVTVLCAGSAIKFIDLPDGRRQILSIRRPGQFLMGCSAMSAKPQYFALALTDVRMAHIERDDMAKSIGKSSDVLCKLATVFAREYDEVAQLVIDLGRRSAQERICHLLCKLVEWAQAPVANNQCIVRLPLRQEDIADYLGLTTAHVNRTIATLRRDKLIALDEDRLKILDYSTLRSQVI